MNTVLTEKIVRTRKPHNCWGCLREFPRGTRMWLNVIDEKPLTTYYYCMTCTALLQEGMMLSKEGQRIKQSVLLTAQRSRGWTISYKRAICPKTHWKKLESGGEE